MEKSQEQLKEFLHSVFNILTLLVAVLRRLLYIPELDGIGIVDRDFRETPGNTFSVAGNVLEVNKWKDSLM